MDPRHITSRSQKIKKGLFDRFQYVFIIMVIKRLRVFCSVKNIMTGNYLGRKRLTSLYILQFIMKRSQGRSSEAGTEAETKQECCSLACSSWLSQLAFLQNPKPSAHRKLGPPMQIINYGNVPMPNNRPVWWK